jgi:hypothetical protein
MSVDWGRYPNFKREEFTCRCGCGRNEMKPGVPRTAPGASQRVR